MKGVNSILNALKRNWDKLCCIVTNTSNTNDILATIATEATQLNVLAAVDMMRDYETRLIVDNSDVTWLEVRYWDSQDGTLGAPKYYEPGNTVEGTPAGASSTWTYINPNTYLSDIVANTGGILADTDTLSTPVTGLSVALLRVTSSGAASVTAGKRRVSFLNAGNSNATVAGDTLRRGEFITFSAEGLRDVLAAIPYDALSTELAITTVG